MRRFALALGVLFTLGIFSTAEARELGYLKIVKSAKHAARIAGRAEFAKDQESVMPAYRFNRPSYRVTLRSVSQPQGKPARAQVYTEVWANSRDSRGRIRIAGAVLDVTVGQNGRTTVTPGWLPTGLLAK
jgi:hypothetical protein